MWFFTGRSKCCCWEGGVCVCVCVCVFPVSQHFQFKNNHMSLSFLNTSNTEESVGNVLFFFFLFFFFWGGGVGFFF